MAANIKAYQIYYNEQTLSRLNPLLLPYNNSYQAGQPPRPCLENRVIAELVTEQKHLNCDYFGVFAWSFEQKNPIKFQSIWPRITGEYDVYSFYGLHTQPNIWQVAERWHPGIMEMGQHIFKKIGRLDINVKKLITPTIYQNAFLARPEIVEEYVKEWLNPFMECLLNKDDEWLYDRVNQDTKYKKGKFNKTLMERVMGRPYYTFHTFLCERLFSTFLSFNPQYKLKHLT